MEKQKKQKPELLVLMFACSLTLFSAVISLDIYKIMVLYLHLNSSFHFWFFISSQYICIHIESGDPNT